MHPAWPPFQLLELQVLKKNVCVCMGGRGIIIVKMMDKKEFSVFYFKFLKSKMCHYSLVLINLSQ